MSAKAGRSDLGPVSNGSVDTNWSFWIEFGMQIRIQTDLLFEPLITCQTITF